MQTAEFCNTDLKYKIICFTTDLCRDAIIFIYLYFENVFFIRLVTIIIMFKDLLTLIAYSQVHVIKEYEICWVR